MLDYISSITRKLSLLLVLSLLTLTAKGQEINGPEGIIASLKYELARKQVEDQDTIPTYAKFLKKLIDRGNYIAADSILSKISTGIELLNDSAIKAALIKERAYMYKVQRRYNKALKDYLWLKSYHEKSKNLADLVEIYCLIAEYYRSIGQNDLFGKHLDLAKDLFKEAQPSNEVIAYWYSRKVAWCTEATGNTDSLLYYARSGLQLLPDTVGILTKSLILNELGFNAMNRKLEENIILDFFGRSKDLLFQQERYRDYVEVINNLGLYHLRAGDPNEGIRLVENIVKMEEANNWFGSLEISYDHLANLHSKIGQLEKSKEYREKSLITAINNIESVHRIQVSDLALSYENSLTEKELQLQAQETKSAQEEAKNNREAFIIATVTAGFLLLIAIVSFLISARFRKKNDLLNKQRNQIQQANSELERSLDQQRILFKELNHRVKNNLSILTGIIYLQEVDEDDESFKNILSTLRNRIKSMALAHESLYTSEEAKKINFQSYLNELFLDLGNALVKTNQVKTHIACEGFNLGLQEAVPLAMIINELFTNSVKHGFKETGEGLISVKAHHEEVYSVIEYIDNGIGFTLEQRKKGTLGLRLVKLLLEQLDGTLEDLSKESGVHLIIKFENLKH